MNNALLLKYNISGPRYTSYPSVPHWSNTPTIPEWKERVKRAFDSSNQKEGLSIYIHLPYCESLCTYCGCNTRITKNHNVEEPYIEALLKEWNLYLQLFQVKPKIREIHLGGGTPTFFSAKNLERLINGLLKNSTIHNQNIFGFELHPSCSCFDHIFKLYDLGFKRVSIGVQDFNKKVMEIINRNQSFKQVECVTKIARNAGYNSINYDLIYGLPLQNRSCMLDTFKKVKQLKPDRIAFYSYAHVPWKKPSQRKFTERDLPTQSQKMELYKLGRILLKEYGYCEIGMDHFALRSDSLSHAYQNNTLHRNFMGYTTANTKLTIGLGVSAISDTGNTYLQNKKNVEEYINEIHLDHFPVYIGHKLSNAETIIKKHILNIMCQLQTCWIEAENQFIDLYKCIDGLSELEKDGLITLSPFGLKVNRIGKPFLRNICMAIDPKFFKEKSEKEIFSKVV